VTESGNGTLSIESREGDGTALTRRDLWLLGGLLAFLLLFFAGALFQPGEVCLGRPGSDARSQFYPWRAYGFGEIREGRFPLWNPHEFLGMPFVATLQSAMFYPPNWLCAVLPLGRAINLGILLGLFLAGVFTYLWCRRLGVSRAGALAAAGVYIFCAPQILRVHEGHWSFLAPMTWIPCVLLCIEALLDGGSWPLAVAGGAAAVAMQWCGGNPQYALYGGVGAVAWLAARMWSVRRGPKRAHWRVAGGYCLFYILGTVLAGAQVVPAMEMFAQSSRIGGIGYEWLTHYCLVPENLITLIVPGFFGQGSGVGIEYWGRWNLWETCAYFGIVALGLVVLAMGRRRRPAMATVASGGACATPATATAASGGACATPATATESVRWCALIVAALLFLVALGPYTPLFRVLYETVPGFDLFRALGRALGPAALFVALLAGLGLDRLAGEGATTLPGRRWVIGFGWAASVLLLLGLFCLFGLGEGLWKSFMHWMSDVGRESRPFFINNALTPEFVAAARKTAGLGLFRAGWLLGGLVIVAALALHGGRRRWVAPAVIGLIAVDVLTFAQPYMLTFDPRKDGLTPGAVAALRAEAQPLRYARGTSLSLPAGEGMAHGLDCIEGIEPNVPARFRRLFWLAQTPEPDAGWTPPATTMYYLLGIVPGFRPLNLTHLVQYADSPPVEMPGARVIFRDERLRITRLPSPFPRAWIVHRATVAQDAEAVCRMMASVRGWDYEREALLEAPPACPLALPRSAEPTPKWLRCEAGLGVIETNAAADGLLIVSDLFYPGWKATVDGRAVDILRANYLLRAVPVPAGKRVVEMHYDPASFKVGLALSATGCLAVAGLVLIHLRGRKRRV
jgi:hypothetical protein